MIARIALLLIAVILGWYEPSLGQENQEGGTPPPPLAFEPRTYTLGGFPRATTTLDIDSDGDLDIIVTNPEKQSIVLLLNKGANTFEVGDNYPIEGYPISIISKDIDKDSDIDLVVLDADGAVRILVQDTAGSREQRAESKKSEEKGRSFREGGVYPVPTFSFSISPSDVNLDENMDLIVKSPKATTILVNDRKGGFDPILTYRSGINPLPSITADLNSDDREDMVIGDKEGISILLNNGDNTFAPGVSYATGEMPLSVAAGDLDSDLDDDLIVANYKSSTISILRNNGDGTFQEAVNYPSGKGPNSIALDDIDLDIDPDIIVTNGLSGEVSIFINNTVRPLAINTDSLPQGLKGKYYETRLEAKGGVPPYNWAVVSGSLPPSLSLDPLTGEIISRQHSAISDQPSAISNQEIASGTLSPRNDEGAGARNNIQDFVIASEAKQSQEDATEGAGGEEAHHGQIPNPKSEIPNEGELLISREALCLCLKAPRGLYRFTVQVTDSSSNTATADLYIEVLPQPGMISGTIRYSGEKRGTIRIVLGPQSQPGGLIGLGGGIYSTIITTPGEYKIKDIYPESYLVGAYLDVNGDGRRQGDEPYGTYGSREKPEAVVVDDDGAELSGIDIELEE